METPASTAAEALAPAAEPPQDPPMQRLDGRVVPYWLLTNVITMAFLLGGGAIGVVWLSGQQPEHSGTIVTTALVAGGLLLLLALVQPVLSYVYWRYGLDEKLLVARHGILFREEKTIPISRLQHVDLRRGPIERGFGLATFVVFTAGSEGATFRVPGLSVSEAHSMRDRVLAARGDDVV